MKCTMKLSLLKTCLELYNAEKNTTYILHDAFLSVLTKPIVRIWKRIKHKGTTTEQLEHRYKNRQAKR